MKRKKNRGHALPFHKLVRTGVVFPKGKTEYMKYQGKSPPAVHFWDDAKMRGAFKKAYYAVQYHVQG